MPLGLISSTILYIIAIIGISPPHLSVDATLPSFQYNLELKKVFEERAAKFLKSKDDKKVWSKEDIAKLTKICLNYNTLISNFVGKDDEPIQQKKKKKSMRLSCSTGTTSLSYVRNLTSA